MEVKKEGKGRSEGHAGTLIRLIIGFLLLLIIPTVCFTVLENFPVFDAFDLTVQTVFSVGYGNVVPKTMAGRIIADAVIIFGTGYSLYVVGFVVSVLTDDQRKERVRLRRMQKELDGLRGHFIVCGFGRVGREVREQLTAGGKQVVVIEKDPTKAPSDMLFVVGDATSDEVLTRCGVGRAKGVVTALSPDSENVALTLAARGLNPKLTVVARGSDITSITRLKRAGADHVVLPTRVGGRYLATLAVRPRTLTFFEQVQSADGMSVEEVEVPETFAGKTLAQLKVREKTGAMVVAIWRGGRILYPNPGQNLELEDRLLVLGGEEDLERFARFSGASS